jgi:hypothetical protein
MHTIYNTTKLTALCRAINTTALQPNVFLTDIHWLNVTDKRELSFPSGKTAKVNYEICSQYQYMFQPNMVIVIRLATGKRRQMYTQLYWD